MKSVALQRNPYRSDSFLTKAAPGIFSKYKELSRFSGPAQNPKGLREVDRRAVEFTAFMLSALDGHPKIKQVTVFDAKKHDVSCPNEDGRIISAIVSPPTYLDWEKAINSKEKANAKNKPDRLDACFQHFGIICKMVEHGADVVLIKPLNGALEGVFTRDPFFAIDGKMYAANMVSPARKAEEGLIANAIKPPEEVKIEGGNVMLGRDAVFLGVGDRTNKAAIEWLQGEVGTEREVIPIMLKKHVLHLDCAFCPVEEKDGTKGSALVYKGAFENPEDLKRLHRMYGDLQIIGKEEYGMLGLNILKLDRNTAIINQGASWMRGMLEKLGISVVELDYSQMVKAEGAWRCTYAAIKRGK